MNNLQLHNKLLMLARDVADLREQHPELSNEIVSLEQHLLTLEEESRGPYGSHVLYHTPSKGV